MRARLTLIVAVLSAAVLVACDRKGAAVPSAMPAVAGEDFKVAFLFEHEGCRVFRFVDSRAYYFVRCDRGAGTVQGTYTQSNGKTTSTHARNPVLQDGE